IPRATWSELNALHSSDATPSHITHDTQSSTSHALHTRVTTLRRCADPYLAPGLPISAGCIRCQTAMRISLRSTGCVAVLACAMMLSSAAAVRQESFDHEPADWEGVNNRNKVFEPKTVEQNFGYSATSHVGGPAGEIGGRINPAGEPAYYGYRLPTPLNLDSPM